MELALVESRFKTAFDQLGLTSYKAVVKFFGANPTQKEVTIVPKTLMLPDGGELSVFYKQYDYDPASWRFVGRASKAQCEFRNYAAFEQLGVPCAQRVACGEQRDLLRRLRRAFVITQAIPGGLPLPQFLQANSPDCSTAQGQRIRGEIVHQLATLTRVLHQNGFFHHDLVVRNVLVTREPKVWLIDCPRGAFSHIGKQRRLIKDLASLDKGASLVASRRERLAFAKLYLGQSRLDATLKDLIRTELAYRKERWPDDWK